jgi:hypothetical protein
MPQLANYPNVFIGSSTKALPVARAVGRELQDAALTSIWDAAFEPGTWLLGGILERARQSDFGIFVIHADDIVSIKGEDLHSVRDNVLFEAGVFMGTLGTERTILLWPQGREVGPRLRLPTDLEGLLRLDYKAAGKGKKPDVRRAVERLRKRIHSLGPALKTGYNELALLKQALYERDIGVKGAATESLRNVLQSGARARKRPWFATSPVASLMAALKERYRDSVVDSVYWWLILYGVITFDNIEQWTSGEWHYKDSVQFATLTPRGVVLLNDLRTSAMAKD